MDDETRQRKFNKRTKAYTIEETNTLLDIVYKYRHIVECEKTYTGAFRQKGKTWRAITHNYNKIYNSQPRTVKELRTRYNNLKKLKNRRAEGREGSDDVSKMFDKRLHEIKTKPEDDEISAATDLAKVLKELLDFPEEEDTKTYILNEPLDDSTHDDTLSMNESSSNTYEDIGSFKSVDISKLNDPLKQAITTAESSTTPENQKKIQEFIYSKHQLTAVKVRREIEIMNIEHIKRLEIAEIEHNRRLEIMNKEHELTVEKLKLEIELRKNNL